MADRPRLTVRLGGNPQLNMPDGLSESVCVSVCLSLFVCLSVYVVCINVYLSVCLDG